MKNDKATDCVAAAVDKGYAGSPARKVAAPEV
jgi:hypothetical protein